MSEFCNNCKDFLNWRKDLESKLRAADELAKAVKAVYNSITASTPTEHEAVEKLNAYEKARGVK